MSRRRYRKYGKRGRRRPYTRSRRVYKRAKKYSQTSKRGVAKAAKRATNPRSIQGKMLRGCIARCSHPNISIREQIIGQGQASATALPLSPIATNTQYTINMTELLMRRVLSVSTGDVSATTLYAPESLPRAYVHNMMVKLTFFNVPTGAATSYISDLHGRVFTYYLANTNVDYSTKDKQLNYRGQWGTKDPVTGAVAAPGISLIYNGQQLGAPAVYKGDWTYLSQAPFNKDVIKFVKVKRFKLRGGYLGDSTHAGNSQRTIKFDWNLEREVKVENQLTFDNVPLIAATDQVDDDMGLQNLLDQSSSGGQSHTYTKYMTFVIDDLSLPVGGNSGAPMITNVAQCQAQILYNMRNI